VNKTQKLILAIFVPIIFFFIAVAIANSLGVTKMIGSYRLSPYIYNPFDLGKTWCVWLVYSASCCLFEFLLFRDNKIIPRKNKED